MELVPLGSLLAYLEEQPDCVSTDFEVPLWASQIACGMQYLQSKRWSGGGHLILVSSL